MKTKSILILVALLAISGCQSQAPKLPDPFDVQMGAFVSKLFDTEGNLKP